MWEAWSLLLHPCFSSQTTAGIVKNSAALLTLRSIAPHLYKDILETFSKNVPKLFYFPPKDLPPAFRQRAVASLPFFSSSLPVTHLNLSCAGFPVFVCVCVQAGCVAHCASPKCVCLCACVEGWSWGCSRVFGCSRGRGRTKFSRSLTSDSRRAHVHTPVTLRPRLTRTHTRTSGAYIVSFWSRIKIFPPSHLHRHNTRGHHSTQNQDIKPKS